MPEVEPSGSLNPCGEVVDLDYPCGGQFPIWLIKLAMDLVLDARVSLRAVPRVLQLLGRLVGQVLVVDWSTVRSWLLRLGCFALRSPIEPAEDVAYLVDFSIQLGTCKCLVIVAVRLGEVPYPERCLRYVDLQIIALVPLEKATGVVVHEELDKAAARTGTPRLIVADQGSDVKKGIEEFCKAHPETAATHDMAHKGARLLQHRLEADQRWPEFLRRLGQTKVGVQQTDQAHLMPPSVRPKARYMNLGPVLRWARRLLRLLDPARTAKVNREKLEVKYGWLREYDSAIAEWSELHEVTQQATVFVRREGYYQSADADLAEHLNGFRFGAAAQILVKEVMVFVAQQSAQARLGERLIGSTEVLESLFGRQKELERQQSKGGFTGLILGLGAQLCDRTAAGVKAALEATPVKVVRDWIGTHLGQSLQSQRQEAFAQLKA